VLLILAIRRIFGQRLSPVVRHTLWLFVALAVLIPGSLLPRPTITLPVEMPVETVMIPPRESLVFHCLDFKICLW